MADFTIGQTRYKSGIFDGKRQIHVMKRLLPAFTALAGVAGEIGKIGFPPALSEESEAALDDEDRAAVLAARQSAMAQLSLLLAPVTEKLAALSDVDVDFILDACLSVTERTLAMGDGWAKVVQNGVVQDPEDNKFATRLQIAWNVVGENFADMFASFGIDLAGLVTKAGGVRG